MGYKIKYTLIALISMIFGFTLAIVLLKSKFVINTIKSIDYASLAFWFSIIFGALTSVLITIFATYFTIKKQEVIKLKAKITERNIDTVCQLLQLTKGLVTMTLQDNKKKVDLEFDYECDHIDEWPISIPAILAEECQTSDWYIPFLMMMESTSRIMNTEIIHCEHFIKEYFLNVYLIYNRIPIDKRWQMAFVLKPDFRNIYSEFSQLLENYLQDDIYKMKQSKKIWDSKKEQSYKKKIELTNFFKYKNQFEYLIP